jgi:hypothetical protein
MDDDLCSACRGLGTALYTKSYLNKEVDESYEGACDCCAGTGWEKRPLTRTIHELAQARKVAANAMDAAIKAIEDYEKRLKK